MEWAQALAILGGNVSMFLWATRQARSDYLHLDKKIEDNRKETSAVIKSFQDEMKKIMEAFLEESKDFHSRLCKIEERKKEK
jgi:hypothetical protein